MELIQNNMRASPEFHLQHMPPTLQLSDIGSQTTTAAKKSGTGFQPDLCKWKQLMCESQGGSKQAYRTLLTEFEAWLDCFITLAGVEVNPDQFINDVLQTVHCKRHTYCYGQCVAAWLTVILQHRLAYPLKL